MYTVSMDSKVEDLIREYLPTKNIMQLATCVDSKPWVCNLHYLSDTYGNIYWMGLPTRRHSLEIEKNPNVSAVILVHENESSDDYIVGITVEGKAEVVPRAQYARIMPDFIGKHGSKQEFAQSVLDGTNPHVFYKITPSKFVLFDTKNFPDDPRQEWSIV